MNTYNFANDNNVAVPDVEEEPEEEFEDAKMCDEEEIEAHIGKGETRSECFCCKWEENSKDYFCMAPQREQFYSTLNDNVVINGLMQNCVDAANYFNTKIVDHVNVRLIDLNNQQSKLGEPPYKPYEFITAGLLFHHRRDHRRNIQSILLDNLEFDASFLKELRLQDLLKKGKTSGIRKIDHKRAAIMKQQRQLQNETIKILLSMPKQ